MRKVARRRLLYSLAAVAVVLFAIDVDPEIPELLTRSMHTGLLRQRSAILREQSQRIAFVLDTTRAIRDALDPDLGWRYKAGFGTPDDHVNAQGLRGVRFYDSLPRPGVLRVAAFGDSFVYGNEVGDADAWCAVLEGDGSDMEVLNYGVGNYGLDQSFLRFQREGMAFRPDVVLVAFVPEDIPRVLSVFLPFRSTSEWPLSKPRFTLRRDGSLGFVANPLPTRAAFLRLKDHPEEEVRALGRLDGWYPATLYENGFYDHVAALRVATTVWRRLDRRFLDPERLIRDGVFNDKSPAFQLQVAIIRDFATAVRAAGATPIVLMLPDHGTLASIRASDPAVYAPLRDELVSMGLRVWDGADALSGAASAIDRVFAPQLHYSKEGNRILASWLATRFAPIRASRSAMKRTTHRSMTDRATGA
jgi:hypothetical protein